jgi:hypothetical protein
MKPAGAPTLFVIDDNAAVRTAAQGVRDAAMDSMITCSNGSRHPQGRSRSSSRPWTACLGLLR